MTQSITTEIAEAIAEAKASAPDSAEARAWLAVLADLDIGQPPKGLNSQRDTARDRQRSGNALDLDENDESGVD